MAGSGYEHRVITTFRPDDCCDASKPEFAENLAKLAELTDCDTKSWSGYLEALRQRRAYFRDVGRATATDHGHPSAQTADLSAQQCQALLTKCLSGEASEDDCELFRAQMLTEMAGMSLEDGMVMQIHPGSYRNHNTALYERFGPDKGADIPLQINYTEALQPLLLAGHYPCLKLGPPWWFHDAPQGMMRFRDQVTETAGFYNTAGFNDDTRAFLSIPARHDVARRMDCVYLSQLVCEHKISMDEARQISVDLTYNLARDAYKLPLERKSV